MESRPDGNKQEMEEPEEERTTDHPSPTKNGTDMQALKQPFDGPLEKRKRVRIFLFDIRYSTFSGQTVKAIQDSGSTYGL